MGVIEGRSVKISTLPPLCFKNKSVVGYLFSLTVMDIIEFRYINGPPSDTETMTMAVGGWLTLKLKCFTYFENPLAKFDSHHITIPIPMQY